MPFGAACVVVGGRSESSSGSPDDRPRAPFEGPYVPRSLDPPSVMIFRGRC